MPFPSPPWHLRARAWVSVFVVRCTSRADRPNGVYAAAFVDYRDGGVLTYRELVVARLVRSGWRSTVRITDIWVDSPTSRDGARALWAIPKDLADLTLDDHGREVGAAAVSDGRVLAEATLTSGRPITRLPFATSTSQEREDGRLVLTPFTGSGRVGPCHATWDVPPDGPLGYLAGRRPVASVLVDDARLRFG